MTKESMETQMKAIQMRLDRLEDHERRNSDILFDSGGGIKLRLDRLEQARKNARGHITLIISIMALLITVAKFIIDLTK